MKVFVRTSQVNEKSPDVVATYKSDAEVPEGAHGEGMTVLELPSDMVVLSPDPLRPMKLKDNWRSANPEKVMDAEADRRVHEVFSVKDQLEAIYDLVSITIDYGTDEAQWPQEARDRKAAIDKGFNYVGQVRDRARQSRGGEVKINPAGDAAWPKRIDRVKRTT